MKLVKPKIVIFDWNGTLVYNDKDNLISNTISKKYSKNIVFIIKFLDYLIYS